MEKQVKNESKKDLDAVDLKFALAFPDLYEIGISHFGMQILYTILNSKENIAAERFFAPAQDYVDTEFDHGVIQDSLQNLGGYTEQEHQGLCACPAEGGIFGKYRSKHVPLPGSLKTFTYPLCS